MEAYNSKDGKEDNLSPAEDGTNSTGTSDDNAMSNGTKLSGKTTFKMD